MYIISCVIGCVLGFSSPRKYSVSGSILPSPRLISTQVFSNADALLKSSTSLLMQFGQFINHDMEFTSQATFSKMSYIQFVFQIFFLISIINTCNAENGEGFVCCGSNNTLLDSSVLGSLVNCLPISVPVNDPQLQNSQEACMNFVRSSTGPNRLSCYLPFINYAEQVILMLTSYFNPKPIIYNNMVNNQLNQNTHWIDASVVYGSNDETLTNLRDPSSGLLKTYLFEGRHLLPRNCSPICLFSAG